MNYLDVLRKAVYPDSDYVKKIKNMYFQFQIEMESHSSSSISNILRKIIDCSHLKIVVNGTGAFRFEYEFKNLKSYIHYKMKVWYQNGIHLILDNKHLLLDPIKGASPDVELTIVSHGHWDHANGLKHMKDETMIMHPATHDYKKNHINQSNTVKHMTHGDTLRINGLKIEAYRSAHCVGSLQYRIIGQESTVVFTGDINLTGTITEKEAEILKGDTLIIETNFGSKKYQFPDRFKSYNDLLMWINKYIDKKPIVLFSHALGKTQELTQLLNDANMINNNGNNNLYMQQLNIISNTLFERHRHRFKYRYHRFTRSVVLEAGDILIYPIREEVTVKAIQRIKDKLGLNDVAFAFVSGWALHQYGDFCFPISSHSGYNELMDYVKGCGAEKVYTFHGFSESFAGYLQKMGIDATAITEENIFGDE